MTWTWADFWFGARIGAVLGLAGILAFEIYDYWRRGR